MPGPGLPGEFHPGAAMMTQFAPGMRLGGRTNRDEAAAMVRMDFAGVGPAPYAGDRAPILITCGPRFPVVATMFRTVGVFLILVASAMWFLPGSQFAADLIVMKLISSLFFLLCGVALVMIHHSDNAPEICFDPIRREFRVLVKAADGRPHIVLRRSYESLGRVQFQKTRVELYDFDGRLLMNLRVTDPGRRAALQAQLRQLVTICS